MNTVQQAIKTDHVIQQLRKYGYKDTDGKTYRELVYRLSVLRSVNEEEAE